MSRLFGEIVEPSTRALIDDDIEEYPDYLGFTPEWEGNATVPKQINSLIVLESNVIKDVVNNCVLAQEKSICKLENGGIEIFQLPNSNYIILYNERKGLNPGQIVEILEKWIVTSKTIYTVTTDSIYNYQSTNNYKEKPVSLVRVISNVDKKRNNLEQPNLVTGLGATILEYCIHESIKKCTLYIIYMDKSPLDSFSCTPIFNVFTEIGIPINNRNIKARESSNNLYM
ncbi:unnamed protein product [Phyllotreta striolata]|uniref:Proteasome assembly chaperone 1 n=1 Tax=Phyllotreta striolata TaxID=444603 RepID=A0A9N9TRV4_PHYSR|nr:unnamed protein product [Phyllotreta striolata]